MDNDWLDENLTLTLVIQFPFSLLLLKFSFIFACDCKSWKRSNNSYLVFEEIPLEEYRRSLLSPFPILK